jgi:cytochrome c553
MREPGMVAWRNPWLQWSVLAVCGSIVAALLVGFVWLPSAQSDFGAQGLWASICRAAGVPQRWGEGGGEGEAPSAGPQHKRNTAVVLDVAMTRPATPDAAGRGATLALQQCTMCHGARGISAANAPTLAGQHAEVIIKQLADYRNSDRSNAVMQALAVNLSEADVLALAAYYASLPTLPALNSHDDSAPALVRVGDPMRNIAPCASCHGGATHKLGAPRLQGMPSGYLAAQLTAFATGSRTNDSHAQMRNMARQLTAAETASLVEFYARR